MASANPSERLTSAPEPFSVKPRYVGYFLTSEQRALAKKLWPHVECVGKPGAQPHLHALSAIERGMCEDLVHEMIESSSSSVPRVLDVGGSVSRNRKRPNVWTCAPVLSAYDATKDHDVDPYDLACSHTAAQCVCHRFDYCVSIHSLYYLTAEDIVSLAHRCPGGMYAVVHPYNEPMGSHWNEAEWYIDYYGNVVCSVKGTSGSWIHPNVSPMLNKGIISFAGRSVAANLVRTIGMSQIWRIVACDPKLPENFFAKNLNQALADSSYVGMVDMRAPVTRNNSFFHASLEPFHETQSSVYRVLSWASRIAFHRRGHRPIVVPKTIVSQLALEIVNVGRSADAYRLLTHKAKSALSGVAMPVEDMVAVLPALVAAAFTHTLSLELDELSFMLTWNAGPLKLHSWAFTFSPVASLVSQLYVHRWKLIAVALAFAASRLRAPLRAAGGSGNVLTEGDLSSLRHLPRLRSLPTYLSLDGTA